MTTEDKKKRLIDSITITGTAANTANITNTGTAWINYIPNATTATGSTTGSPNYYTYSYSYIECGKIFYLNDKKQLICNACQHSREQHRINHYKGDYCYECKKNPPPATFSKWIDWNDSGFTITWS